MRGKKGFFFTVTAIIVIAVSLSAFFTMVKQSTPNSRSVEARIYTLDSFLRETKSDLDRALYISSFRSIMGLSEYVISNGQYVNNTEAAFQSAIFTASYKGDVLAIMQNATLTEWRSRIDTQAKKIGVEFNVTFLNITIAHTSPWDISVSLNCVLIVRDLSNVAIIRVPYTTSASLSILGKEDPLYPVNTLGRVSNIINKTIYTRFVNGSDTTNLTLHLNRGYYLNHSDAPSYLMRLEGNLTGSPYGIESLVVISEIAGQMIATKNRTSVDYIYFGAQNVTDYAINNMPDGFRLDEAHLDTYQARGLKE